MKIAPDGRRKTTIKNQKKTDQIVRETNEIERMIKFYNPFSFHF